GGIADLWCHLTLWNPTGGSRSLSPAYARATPNILLESPRLDGSSLSEPPKCTQRPPQVDQPFDNKNHHRPIQYPGPCLPVRFVCFHAVVDLSAGAAEKIAGPGIRFEPTEQACSKRGTGFLRYVGSHP